MMSENKKQKIPCSVGLLTLNSGAYLEPALESLKDFEDVFLLDGNSTDNTLDIAKKFEIPVYKQVETEEKNIKISNFTQMREKTLELSKCEWVFFCDSDEVVDSSLVEEVRAVVKQNLNVGYNIQKKYLVKDKKIEHCFNYPNYYLRLYPKRSGIHFRPGKIVHEQMTIPKEIEVKNLVGAVYSRYPDTYKECVKKDKYYVELAKRNMFPAQGRQFPRWMCARNSVRYFLRAGNIFYKTLKTYVKYGYKDSLPFLHALRHVRYHLIVSLLCLKQIFV